MYTMKTLLKDFTRVAKYVEDPAIRKLLQEKAADKEDEQGGSGKSHAKPSSTMIESR